MYSPIKMTETFSFNHVENYPHQYIPPNVPNTQHAKEEELRKDREIAEAFNRPGVAEDLMDMARRKLAALEEAQSKLPPSKQ